MEYLLLIIGLSLILVGANSLTNGSAALAKRVGVSEFIVGLTVVAVGTSAPEFVVTIISAIDGVGNVAVGNISGSNIFNILVILGVVALIRPVELTKVNIRKDIPYGVVASLVMFIVIFDKLFFDAQENVITRSDGMLMLIIYFMFMSYTIYKSKKETPQQSENSEPLKKVSYSLLLITVGLAMLIYGGQLFLDSAMTIAKDLGISEKIIAITLMAGGTSVPELASCIVAVVKKKSDMALGNVIGSNISNILLILGTGATITPLKLGDITIVDISMVVVSSILLFITAFTFAGKRINRIEGAIFILIYVLYIYYLVVK